jgi:hypothetical protein
MIWSKKRCEKVKTLFGSKSNIKALALVGTGHVVSAGDDGILKVFALND